MVVRWNSHNIQADSGSVVPVALEEASVLRVEAPEAGSVDLTEALAAQVVADPEAGKNVEKETVPFFTFCQ